MRVQSTAEAVSSSIDPMTLMRQASGRTRLPPESYTFSTCAKSSSTPVARPKIVTDTLTLDFS